MSNPVRLEVWQCSDKQQFINKAEADRHEAELHGLKFKCPNCNATGQVQGAPIIKSVIDEEAMAHQGWHPHTVYKDVITGHHVCVCSCCRGMGYTKHQLEPITETKTVGWK